jgi:hypothetical protein
MPKRVSRQRRETAAKVVDSLLDPKFREPIPLAEDGQRRIMIALWSDPLAEVLDRARALGGNVRLSVSPPRGRGLFNLDLEELPESSDESHVDQSPEKVTAAPTSTVGMLLDSLGRDGTFHLVMAESELRGFTMALAGTGS